MRDPSWSTPDVPAGVQGASRASGRPLDPTVRGLMEARFGQDFGNVLVHTDAQADVSAKALRARAYSIDEDLVFADGRYAPGTEGGQRLLAHELAHVAQRRQGGGSAEEAERRAKLAAERVHRRQPVGVVDLGGAPAGIHRAGEGESTAVPTPPSPTGRTYTLDPELGKLNVATLDGFALNSAALTEEHRSRIAGLAEMLRVWLYRPPLATVRLIGHADATGDEKHNAGLGLRRANAARDALVAAGVPDVFLETESMGETVPLVDTQEAEPRNRRVEVRYEMDLSTPSAGLGMPRPEGAPVPSLTYAPSPVLMPPWLTTPSVPGPAGPSWGAPGGPSPPRAGTIGDLMDAVLAIPEAQKARDQFLETHKRRLGGLSTGERIAVGTTTALIGAGLVAGIWSDPAARKSALDMLNGKEVPVPGIPGAKVKILTDPGGGLILKYDLARVIPGLK